MESYDLTPEECAVRREWYTLALEIYEKDPEEAAGVAVFGALVGGDFRRLELDHKNAIRVLAGRLAETLIHPSGSEIKIY